MKNTISTTAEILKKIPLYVAFLVSVTLAENLQGQTNKDRYVYGAHAELSFSLTQKRDAVLTSVDNDIRKDIERIRNNLYTSNNRNMYKQDI